MIDSCSFLKLPLDFKGKLKIYPPSISKVIQEPNFNILYRILTITSDDIQEEIQDKIPEGENAPTPFEYIMANAQYIKGFSQLLRSAFKFFCNTDIGFLFEDNKIIIGDIVELTKQVKSLEQIEYLTSDDYFEFQNMIRISCGDKMVEPPIPIDPDEDPRIRRIKDLARKRERVKAKQASKKGISLSTCLVAICCMGIGITPLNIGEMSYASIGPIMKMMQDKEKYDIDIRSLLAGADSKKLKPKYWIRNEDKD